MTIEIGQKAPEFSAASDTGAILSSADYKDKAYVIYFYPKDDTPGCTTEACTFTENISAFNALDVSVIGVSKDSVASHKKFKDKYKLNFPLLSDADGKICESYGTWVEKSMYGKKYMGIDRATFLIGADGLIKAIWRKVKVPGHIGEVLETIKKAAD